IRAHKAQTGPAMSLVRRLSIIEQICAGLHAAHQRDIVHRDIKPDNVMVLGDGSDRVKILDFGLARLGAAASGDGDQGGARLTRAGWVMGTFHYMSPEQVEGKTVDGRADMFSLGAVFYELL